MDDVFSHSKKAHWDRLCFLSATIDDDLAFRKYRNVLTLPLEKLSISELILHFRDTILTDDVVDTLFKHKKEDVLFNVSYGVNTGNHIFITSATHGNLELMKHIKITDPSIILQGFQEAAVRNDLRIVKWIAEMYPELKQNHNDILFYLPWEQFDLAIFGDGSPINMVYRFTAACGSLVILEFLTDYYKPTKNTILEAFAYTTKKGQFISLEWLAKRFEITKAEITRNHNFILRCAAANNHVDIFKWLIDRFNLTTEDIEDCVINALELSTKTHDWIKSTYNTTARPRMLIEYPA